MKLFLMILFSIYSSGVCQFEQIADFSQPIGQYPGNSCHETVKNDCADPYNCVKETVRICNSGGRLAVHDTFPSQTFINQPDASYQQGPFGQSLSGPIGQSFSGPMGQNQYPSNSCHETVKNDCADPNNCVKETVRICNGVRSVSRESTFHSHSTSINQPDASYPENIRYQEECGQASTMPRPLIWNGREADVGELPWHVGVYERQSDGKFKQICGGSIISPRYVISVAHCFTEYNKETENVYFKKTSDLRIAAGKHFRDYDAPGDRSTVQKMGVKSVSIPSKYNAHRSQYEGDMAVVLLQEGFKYTKNVGPICIDNGGFNFESLPLTAGSEGMVVGWGKTEVGKMSDKLKITKLPYVPMKTCKNNVGVHWDTFLRDDKICMGSKKLDSLICQGDSGGGLVFLSRDRRRYYLRGMVSLGLCDGTEGFSIFTKYSHYQDMVQKKLSQKL